MYLVCLLSGMSWLVVTVIAFGIVANVVSVSVDTPKAGF
jgi:hypothetical protein